MNCFHVMFTLSLRKDESIYIPCNSFLKRLLYHLNYQEIKSYRLSPVFKKDHKKFKTQEEYFEQTEGLLIKPSPENFTGKHNVHPINKNTFCLWQR